MSRLKLWVLVALVAGAGVAHLVVASGWVAARAGDELDRSLKAAVAQLETGSRLLARQVADVAHLAALDPALRAAIAQKAAPPPRGKRPLPPRPTAEPSALVDGAVRSAARALGVDVSRGLVASFANDRGLALQSGAKMGKQITGVSDQARRLLLGYDFPGNVRELENIIEHAFVICGGNRIDLDCLPKELTLKQKKTDLSVSLSLKEEHPLGKAEAEIVIRTLEKNGGSRVKAAEELGVSRATLWRKIKRYGLT